MAGVNDILNIDNYQGQVIAGGNYAVSGQIDTSPIAQLAQFTYSRNRAQWDRDNQKRDEMIGKIAEITSLDPVGLLQEQNEVLLGVKKELDEMSENPDYLNPDKNPKQWFEYTKKYNDYIQKINRANKNNISAKQWKEEIDAESDPKLKEIKQKQFDLAKKKFFEKGAENVLNSGDLFAPKNKVNKLDYQVPEVVYNTFTTETDLGNQNQKIKREFIDYGQVEQKALEVEMGLSKGEYNYNYALSKEENEELKLRNDESYEGSKSQFLNEIIDVFNNNPKSPQAELIIKEVDVFNDSVTRYNEEVEKMKREGKKINAKTAKLINLQDGLQPHELIMLKSTQGKNGIKEYKEDLTKTGLAQDKAELAEKTRANKAGEGLDRDKLNLQKRQFEFDKHKWNSDRIPPKPTANKEDLGNVIYGINSPLNSGKEIVNGVVYNPDGSVDGNYNETVLVTQGANANILETYNSFQKSKGSKNEVLKDENGNLIAQFKNGVISGFKTTNGSFNNIQDYDNASDWESRFGRTDKEGAVDIGVKKGRREGGTQYAKEETISIYDIPLGAKLDKNGRYNGKKVIQ